MFFFIFLFLFINLLAITKILVQDRKLRLKECLYFIVGYMLILVIAFIIFATTASEHWLHLLDIPFFAIIFFYLRKLKAYPAKKAISLTTFALLIMAVNDTAVATIMHTFFPYVTPIASVITFILLLSLSITFTALFMKFTRKLRTQISQDKHMQSAVLFSALFLFTSFQASVITLRVIETTETIATLYAVNWISFAVYLCIAFLILFFYRRALEIRLTSEYELKRKDEEQKALQHYTDELEQQQVAIRKFKHDYQNILSSMEIFFEEKDLDGLTQYYNQKIKVASNVITQNEFALDGLGKIKVKEIRGILVAKLTMAQNLGLNATFIAMGEIDYIPVDSVSLVRMLSILLDNAIEALAEVESGNLMVSCLKSESTISFVVQNTCPPNMPPLRSLSEPGFSTKGKDRGMGLHNLSELTASLPHVTLSTKIEDGYFSQILVIGSDV